eukprot:906136-Pelagomonas_calceolata.AAC.1
MACMLCKSLAEDRSAGVALRFGTMSPTCWIATWTLMRGNFAVVGVQFGLFLRHAITCNRYFDRSGGRAPSIQHSSRADAEKASPPCYRAAPPLQSMCCLHPELQSMCLLIHQWECPPIHVD